MTPEQANSLKPGDKLIFTLACFPPHKIETGSIVTFKKIEDRRFINIVECDILYCCSYFDKLHKTNLLNTINNSIDNINKKHC